MNIFIITTIFILSYAWFIVLSHRDRVDSNQCEMTFMRPSFHKLEFEEDVGGGKLNEKYAVYRYKEDDYYSFDDDYSNNKKKKKIKKVITLGLFVPGNGGDYKQVRSIAHWSHALRRHYFQEFVTTSSSAEEEEEEEEEVNNNNERFVDHYIEWYAMDFKEELSAFDADVMERQVEAARFVLENFFVKRIRNNDENKNEEEYLVSANVVVVGHSMGGLVAKYAAFHKRTSSRADDDDDDDAISRVFVTTLATPHAFHPGAFSLSSFMNHAWRKYLSLLLLERGEKNTTMKTRREVELLSVNGGIRDWQVSGIDASFVRVRKTDEKKNVKTVMTRTSCDHLAICWCKQVVLSLAVQLHESESKKTNATNSGEDGVLNNLLLRLEEKIPAELRWRNFFTESPKKERGFVFVDVLSDKNDDNPGGLFNHNNLETFLSILVARTPNVASAAIFWHVMLSNGGGGGEKQKTKKSATNYFDGFSSLLALSFYFIFALMDVLSISGKEMKTLKLEPYVALATIVVLVSGLGAAKIMHAFFCKILISFASARNKTTNLRIMERMLTTMPFVFQLSLCVALSLVSPALTHAYLIVFKCVSLKKKKKQKVEIIDKSFATVVAHSCSASSWICILLLPSLITKVKDRNLPGIWSLIDSCVAFASAISTIIIGRPPASDQYFYYYYYLSLLICSMASGAGMASIVHLGFVFF
jgi:hypothetical protein